MLARGARAMPIDLAAWSFEPKWDGWRCLARIDGGRLRLTTRWRNDLTSRFPELGELPDAMAERRLLLDGEDQPCALTLAKSHVLHRIR
jgi:bifunctional non-homologous end joining protein LigD